MIAYKIVRKRKDGTYGPLYINRKLRMEPMVTYRAEEHPTKGYAYRPGFHCVLVPKAPHIKMKPDRVWVVVSIMPTEYFDRPDSQGGLWALASHMTILGELGA